MNDKKNVARTIERQFMVLRPVVAISIAVAIAFIVIVAASNEPLEALKMFVFGPISTKRRFGNVLEMLIPFIFTGCAICVLYSTSVFNMAAEGAFFLGGIGASYIAISYILPAGIHPFAAIVFAGLVGAAVCLIPAFLFVRWKAEAVVSSLMLNYVCLYFGLYIINYQLRDPQAGFMASMKFSRVAMLPKILSGTNLHAGIFIAAAAVIVTYYFLFRSRWGYAVRIIGKNRNFAQYSGIAVGRTIIFSQMIGGFLAGAGGGVQLMGMYDRFQYQQLPQFGFDGILIAILAKFNPKYVPVTGLFLAYIRTGAEIMSRTTDVPVEIVLVVQAVIILLLAAQLFLQKWKHRRIVAASQKELAMTEVK